VAEHLIGRQPLPLLSSFVKLWWPGVKLVVKVWRHGTATDMWFGCLQVPPLTWDEGLASQAAAFVADCPLKHSYIRNIGESLGW
jgi:hypothetical protein